jgi:hypothetical protein
MYRENHVITVTPQESDLLAAIWMRRKRMFMGKMGLLIWFGAAGVVLGCILIIVYGPKSGLNVSIGYWILGIYAWVWVLIGFTFLLTPIKVRRLYKKLKLAEMPYTLDWDDENLIMESAHSKTFMPWQEYTVWLEDKRLIVLYRRGVLPKYIPKRILNEKQSHELYSILLEKIGPKGVIRKA